MYVCICAAVTDARVHECLRDGARTVEDVGRHCGAGTGCGSCLDRLDGLVDSQVSGANTKSCAVVA